ncbi:MAG: TlpA disulfide reductase family protein [Candidatus Auribacterota bacterium]|nr:TlpA disulfide reductase family protein [Candidatus Auribacterota bacterium]
MKTFKQLAIIGVILSVILFSSACDQGSAGQTSTAGLKAAPDFNLKKFGGGRAKLSDYRGKIVILDFWSTWCPPCRKEIPDFVKLQKSYGDKKLVILGISLDQNPKHALPPFIRQYNMNYPILLTDGRIDKAYGGVTGIPTTFVINQKGEIYQRYVGFRPKHVFEKDIQNLLGN